MVAVRRVFDRTVCLLLTTAVLVPDFAVGHELAKREKPSSFLVQLGYLKAEFSTSRTCIAVLPGGRFHLEKSWSTEASWAMQVFEGTLSDKSLRSLSEILAVDDLKGLKSVQDHPHFGLPKGPFDVAEEGEVVRAVIPRPEGPQDLSLGSTSPKHPRPLPDAVKPLIQWIRATTKQVERQKGSLVKDRKLVDCWLQEP